MAMGLRYDRARAEADVEEARVRGESGGKYLLLKKDKDRAAFRPLPVERVDDDVLAQLFLKYAHHYLGRAPGLGLDKAHQYQVCLNYPAVSEHLPAAWGANPCRFCARNKDLRDSRDPDDQELADHFKPSFRFAANVKVAKGDVMIFRNGASAGRGKHSPLESFAELVFDPKWEGCLSLKNGNDVIVTRHGTDLDTEYTFKPDPDAYTIPESVLDDLHDLYADIRLLSPDKQAQVLKGGAVADDDYVTLRELMDAKEGRKPSRGASREKGRAAELERAAASAADGSDRMPTKKELGLLAGFLKELDANAEFADDKTYAECVESLIVEALDVKVKSLSEDFRDWLDAGGCDVSGRTVARRAPEKAEPAKDGGELTEVERQIAEVRKRRLGAKK